MELKGIDCKKESEACGEKGGQIGLFDSTIPCNATGSPVHAPQGGSK